MAKAIAKIHVNPRCEASASIRVHPRCEASALIRVHSCYAAKNPCSFKAQPRTP